MKNIVLLVVDVQNGLVNNHPYNEEKVIENITMLIKVARDNGKEVIYVQHDDGQGSELERDTYSWQVYDEIAPNSDEMIIHKEFNSAFHKTNLKDYLDSKNVGSVMLVGMQTEYCIDATCKSAFDNGYKIIMPKESNTTFDNDYLSGQMTYEFYNYKIWNNRFASVISMTEAVQALEVR